MITVTAPEFSPTRTHPRVDAGFMVKLFTRGRAVVAKASDLSMAGLKLLGDFSQAEDRLTLAIPLPGDDREVVTKATVRRRSADELGLEFDQLDWDDLFAIARFLHPRLP